VLYLPDKKLGKTIEKALSKLKIEKDQYTTEETSSSTTSPEVSNISESSSAPTPPKTMEKVFLKALPLKSIEDIELFKQEVKSGNILIVRVSPLAKKSIDDVKNAVSKLCEFTESVGGDIARLGEERVVITPAFVKIWRERADTTESESTAA